MYHIWHAEAIPVRQCVFRLHLCLFEESRTAHKVNFEAGGGRYYVVAKADAYPCRWQVGPSHADENRKPRFELVGYFRQGHGGGAATLG